MKKKLLIYVAFVLFFLILIPVFMSAHANIFNLYGFQDKLLALWHGLPHSLAVSAWIMLPAFAVGIPYVWIRGDWHRLFMIYYIPIAFIPVILLCCIDLVLYGFWGFRLDTTPLVYILDDPLTALQESPVWAPFASLALIVFFVWCIFSLMKLVYPRRRSGSSSRMSRGRQQQMEGLYNTLLTVGMLLIALWPTMGSAYFTDQQPLNHAATNPIFSFFHSVRQQQQPLAQQYRFMSEQEMQAALQELNAPSPEALPSVADDSLALAEASSALADTSMLASVSSILTTSRPNVLLVLFESFSGAACHYLYPEADPQIMPNVNQAMAEGVAFTQFYANSFRTERGMVSVLSSYPGQPTYTLMTDTLRTARLDYLPQALREAAGYDFHFVHGGDASFTHLSQYLRYAGASSVTDRKDFAEHQQLCQWGVHDDLMFEHLAQSPWLQTSVSDSVSLAPQTPHFTTFLTLSSHEPFEVPFSRFPDDPYLNSVAYTDSCFGAFVSRLKADSALWSNLLIIGMPDHAYAQYPQGIQQSDPLRYHIPMFWIGGAVGGHSDVSALGSQVDLSATLLSLLAPEASQLVPAFSHDLLSPQAPHYAFYAWPDGFGLLSAHGTYVQDNNYDSHPLPGSNDPEGRVERMGKAYLQHLYDDLGAK